MTPEQIKIAVARELVAEQPVKDSEAWKNICFDNPEWTGNPATQGNTFVMSRFHIDQMCNEIESLRAELKAARQLLVNQGSEKQNLEVKLKAAREADTKLRQILSNCAKETGAHADPNCSIEFLSGIPNEIRLCREKAELELKAEMDRQEYQREFTVRHPDGTSEAINLAFFKDEQGVEHLTAEAVYHIDLTKAKHRLRQAKKQRDELKRYLEHDRGCEKRHLYRSVLEDCKCTCGLDEILKG